MEILPVSNQFSSESFNSDKDESWSNSSSAMAEVTEVTEAAVAALSERLERELRAAKRASPLHAGAVLLPGALLARCARRALRLAAPEPCGARGAALIVHVAGRRLAAFKLDAGTLTTHELHLTLTPAAHAAWLPLFLQRLSSSAPLVISPDFTITKTRLYRSQDH